MTRPLSNPADPENLAPDPEPAPDHAAVVRDYLAKQSGGELPQDRFHHHPRSQKPYTPLSPDEIDSKLSRRPWEEVSPPQEVADAYGALCAAVDLAHESSASVRSLASDEERERVQAEAAVSDAIRAGETPPRPVFTDWTGEALVRIATDRQRREKLADARAAYEDAVAEHRDAWLAGLRAELESRRAEALTALEAAEPAIRAYADLAWELEVFQPRERLDPEDFLDEAKARMDPRTHAYAFRLARELAEEAEAERRAAKARRHGAPDGLDRIRAALRA